MTLAFYCVLIAALMPIMWTGYAKLTGPGFNNHTPRNYQAGLTGKPQRAYWAHLNSFEALAPFAAAVIIAHLAGGPRPIIDYLAMAWVALRLIFGLLYISDQATPRSLAWMAATGCWIAMFFV